MSCGTCGHRASVAHLHPVEFGRDGQPHAWLCCVCYHLRQLSPLLARPTSSMSALRAYRSP